jgi:hypothetical protein
VSISYGKVDQYLSIYETSINFTSYGAIRLRSLVVSMWTAVFWALELLNLLQFMYLYISYSSPNQHLYFPVENLRNGVSNGSAVLCEVRSDNCVMCETILLLLC